MLIWQKTISLTHAKWYQIPINCTKVEITMVKRKRLNVQITINKTLHRKQKIEQRNVTFATNLNEICFNMIWMHYIVKYVQLYIKVLRISPNTCLCSYFYRESRINCEQSVVMEKQWIPVSAPPIGTSLPCDYKHGLSIVSLAWTDSSRGNTPADMFTVKRYN